jgi:hypothetical protein
MIVRLVQSFKNFRLAMEDHPESLPPPEWKASGVGRKAVEKVHVRGHLTIYAKVRHVQHSRLPGSQESGSNSYLSQGGVWVKMDEA